MIRNILNAVIAIIKRFVAVIGWQRTLVATVLGAVIFYSPAIVLFIVGQPILATSYVAIWAGPFTPAIPIAVLICLCIAYLITPLNKRELIKGEINLTKEKIKKEWRELIAKIKYKVKRGRETR